MKGLDFLGEVAVAAGHTETYLGLKKKKRNLTKERKERKEGLPLWGDRMTGEEKSVESLLVGEERQHHLLLLLLLLCPCLCTFDSPLVVELPP